MTTITTFLLDRITEEENAARIGAATPEAAMNITRWHPAHVLAECEAKRRIVKLAMLQEDLYRVRQDDFQQGATAAVLETLRHLAQVYADHPDYNPAWNN